VQLLVSHIATDTFLEKEEREMGYFEFQLRTTRNIDCQGRSWEHVLHGGLEYQIEHHLFPQLPRHNLHLVKPYVMSICTQHNIKYESVTFTKALGACWTRMQDLANDIILPHEICTATSEESIRVPIGRT
jgi:delta8-fatty-acid desaturase